MFSTLLGFALLMRLCSGAYDYYDVNEVYNEFIVDCGTVDEPLMRITYGGDANAVYAVDAPVDCRAQEVAPAVFLLEILDYADPTEPCPVVTTTAGGVTPLMTLDVVVQTGTVRQWDDAYRQITCNYGLGGQERINDTDTEQGSVDKQPVWSNVGENNSNDTVTLHVFDTDNAEVTMATLGNYIQVRAHLSSIDGNSIKVFNCRGYNGDMSYYLLIGGCGEGDVMALNRGFRTQEEVVTIEASVTRVARSSYFKSFLLPGYDSITFECDYILCDPTDCDGYSCANSVMLSQERRRKRDAPTSSIPARGAMPKVQTASIRILPQANEQQFVISSADLIRAEGDLTRSFRQGYSQADLFPANTSQAEPETTLDMMTLGLIIGMAFLAVLLVITLVCTVMVCRRSLLPGAHHPDDSMQSPMIYPTKRP